MDFPKNPNAMAVTSVQGIKATMSRETLKLIFAHQNSIVTPVEGPINGYAFKYLSGYWYLISG